MNDQFEKLNLNINEIINLPVSEKIQVINQALLDFVPAAERATAAAALFGARSGVFFGRLDQESYKRAIQETVAYGVALTELDKRHIAAVEDSMSSLTSILNNLARKIVASYAPAITRWADAVKRSLAPGGKLRDQVTRIAQAIDIAINSILEFGRAVTTALDKTAIVTIASVYAFTKLLAVIKSVKIAVVALGTAFSIGVGASLIALGPHLGILLRAVTVLTIGLTAAKSIYKSFNDQSMSNSIKNIKMVADNWETVSAAMREASTQSRGFFNVQKDIARLELNRMRADAMKLKTQIQNSDEYKALIEQRKRDAAVIASPIVPAVQGHFAALVGGEEKQGVTMGERLAAIARRSNTEQAARDMMKPFHEALNNYHLAWDEFNNTVFSGGASTAITSGQLKQIEDIKRAISDVGTKTTVFSELQRAVQWHKDISDEIRTLNGLYPELQVEANHAFETMKRHAMGLYTPLENLTTVIDGIKDKFQSVSDAMVDHLVDGTTKISDAFKRMAIAIAKELVWLNIRSGLSAIGSHLFGAVGQSPIPVAPIPGTNPIQAMGGTINANTYAGAFDRGGTIGRGQWGWVGENNPEIVTGPATVYNPMRMGGASNVNLAMSLHGDMATIRQAISQRLEEAVPVIADGIMGSVADGLRNPSALNSSMKEGLAA